MRRLSHSRNQALDPAVRSADAADQGGRSRYFQINSRRSSHAPAPLRHSHSHPHPRLARRRGRPRRRLRRRHVVRRLRPRRGPAVPGARGTDASPAAYSGSDLTLAESCDDLLDWYVERGLDLVGPYGWGGNPNIVYDFARELGRRRRRARTDGSASGAGPGPRHERRDRHQRAGGRRRRAGRRQDRRQHAVPGPGRRPGHLRRERRRGRAARARSTCPGPPAPTAPRSCCPATPWSRCRSVAPTGAAAAAGHRAGDRRRLGPDRPRGHPHGGVRQRPGHRAAARRRGARWCSRPGCPTSTSPSPTTTPPSSRPPGRTATSSGNSTIEDWLPSASLDGGAEQPVLGCDQVAIPDDGTSLGTIAVVGFDASAPDAPSVSGLAVDTDLAYASADQLYLATSPTYGGIIGGCFDCMEPFPVPDSRGGLLPGWLPGGDDDGVDCCSPIPAPRGDLRRRQPPLRVRPGRHRHHVRRVRAGGRRDPRPLVDGRRRQGDDAVLRVAVGPNGSTGNFNSIVTFRQEGNDLVESGRLDELGVGEEIESVRWFDTLAIIVTFRQVDPLYAIDLTDPDQPLLMGSLKIPGFSAYLHPLGQHRLLGLGQLQGSNGTVGRPGRAVQRHRPHQPPAARRRGVRPGQPGPGRPGPAPAHLAARRPHRAHRHRGLRQGRQRRLRLGAHRSARASCPTGWSRSSTATR